MTILYFIFSSIGKYLTLVLLLLNVITIITTDASPVPATEAEIHEFKLWVQYANAAYYDVTDWKCPVCNGDTVGTRLIKKFTISPTRDNGYVAMNDKEKAIIVAYRGYHDQVTLARIMQIKQVPFSPSVPNALVSEGFLSVYHETSNEITSLVRNLVKENPSYKVIATGHSLGGTLSTFQALDLISTPGLNPSNLFTYTYGEPCNGNTEFAQFIMNSGFKFSRLVDREDLVPYLPPVSFNYFQYGPEYWINSNMQMVVCQDVNDKSCSKSLPNKTINAHRRYFEDLAANTHYLGYLTANTYYLGYLAAM